MFVPELDGAALVFFLLHCSGTLHTIKKVLLCVLTSSLEVALSSKQLPIPDLNIKGSDVLVFNRCSAHAPTSPLQLPSWKALILKPISQESSTEFVPPISESLLPLVALHDWNMKFAPKQLLDKQKTSLLNTAPPPSHPRPPPPLPSDIA